MKTLDCTTVDIHDRMFLSTQVDTNRQEEKMSIKKYPANHISWESGCKVGWITYPTLDLAEQCSKLASENAVYLSSKGYDFGYQSPGAITKVESGWMVVIP